MQGLDLNQRPSGYEPDELPDCSTLRRTTIINHVFEKSQQNFWNGHHFGSPAFLEFLTSVAMVQNFDGLDVRPNYPVDDEGLPVSTAAGGYSDIECFDNDYDTYCEVTLMCGRADQVNNEVIPISRHLQDAIRERREKSFAVLIAPIIHADTIEACDWQRHKYNVDIIPYNIEEFIETISAREKASGLLDKVATVRCLQ